MLHNHTWFGHVLQHHPDMRPYRALASAAVTDPIEIRVSDANPEARVYFGRGPRPGTMIAVAANLAGGFVMTAHLVRRAKGVMEWSSSTP